MNIYYIPFFEERFIYLMNSRSKNRVRRNKLISQLAPALSDISREELIRAPYAAKPEISKAKANALIYAAIELTSPPGAVIGRRVVVDAQTKVEILIGWERVEALLHPDAFPRASSVPVGLIEVSDADAAFYAIEYAARDQAASGLRTSPLLYAAAAKTAISHFSRPEKTWSIQALADALTLARPTLSNRLRLLKGLGPKTQALLQAGEIHPECAKILLGEHSQERQDHLAELVSRGMMSTRALYRLVHPDYQPPRTLPSSRSASRGYDSNITLLERSLSERFGTAATVLKSDRERQCHIELPYYSLSELKGLMAHLEQRIENESLVTGTLTLSATSKDTTHRLLDALGAGDESTLEH
ncbi:MAG: hypothetical protein AAF098_06730 [Pseudomonadota bacterium]